MSTPAEQKRKDPKSKPDQNKKYGDSEPLSDSELDDLLTDVEEAVSQSDIEEPSPA